MPIEFITNILAQIPFVAAFVWYSYTTNKQNAEVLGQMNRQNAEAIEKMMNQFQQFLREEREARVRQEDKFLERLNGIEKDFVDHDNRMMAGITRMEERTAIRETPTKPRTR
jgi:hypothetical protein